MRAVVQRVSEASVAVAGRSVARIGPGLLVLLGVGHGDTAAMSARLATKIAKLRIFADAAGKMNLDVAAAGGSVLVVSQFTLYADLHRGNRPGFAAAAPPEQATARYRDFVAGLRERGLEVATGHFGATMEVALINDGPVTIVVDSETLPAGRTT